MDVVLLVAGLAILFVGGEATLRGAIGLAKKLGVSPAIIGLTVVGFGTSAPELVVTIQAALAGQPDIAVGNVVGSNISNLLLVLGVGAAIWPLTCEVKAARRDAAIMIATSILLVVLGLTGTIYWWEGLVMVLVLCIFLYWSYREDKKDQRAAALHAQEAEELDNVPTNPALTILFSVVGLAMLVGGADLMVRGAVGIAQSFGVPESVIGLTVVALGTSLPELAATAIAAYRRHTDVAIANIMGSCAFNVLFIIGTTAMVAELPVARDIQTIDLWVMLASSVLVTVLLLKACRIGRAGGWVMLSGYCVYIASMGARIGL